MHLRKLHTDINAELTGCLPQISLEVSYWSFFNFQKISIGSTKTFNAKLLHRIFWVNI